MRRNSFHVGIMTDVHAIMHKKNYLHTQGSSNALETLSDRKDCAKPGLSRTLFHPRQVFPQGPETSHFPSSVTSPIV